MVHLHCQNSRDFLPNEMPVGVYPVNIDTFRIDRCINEKIMGISVIGSW